MSTTYEHTTTTVSSGPQEEIRPDTGYIRTVPGILKIVEVFLDILILICASIDNWYSVGGGWVQFVAASAMVTTAILFFLHFFHIMSRIPAPTVFIEFVYYIVYVILLLIAAIVAAVRAPWWPSVGAACFFTFAAVAVYAVDCFFLYRAYRSVQHPHTTGGASSAGGATTVVTTTTYEKSQY
ncbi:uncharacterized protein LOC143286018 [Babylonia areolata]|uniref:uncharacterized protein LOC143286018 n=1 Tax=Babylonia areolata TaxID=304850 RepID=UPI003FD47BE3